jgi:hypothetical protein
VIWVSEMKDGKPTGRSDGYSTLELAKEMVDLKREWRDREPQYRAFKDGNYDWNILEFIGDSGDFKVVY